MGNNNIEMAGGKPGGSDIRKIAVTGMLSAVSFLLMFIDFSVPFMPSFIKLDISELPALVGTFSLGPVYGVIICLVKNLINFLVRSSTGGVGEFSNFILGAVFVFISGIIYDKKRTRNTALWGSVLGAFAMGIFSIISNYYLVYPIYYNFMPQEAILAAYQAIYPGTNSILHALVIFNFPFTFFKGMLDVLITMLIYKRISPLLKSGKS